MCVCARARARVCVCVVLVQACANKSATCGGWNMPSGKHGDCNLISQADHDWHPVGTKDPCVSAYKFDGGVGHISDGALGGYWCVFQNQ